MTNNTEANVLVLDIEDDPALADFFAGLSMDAAGSARIEWSMIENGERLVKLKVSEVSGLERDMEEGEEEEEAPPPVPEPGAEFAQAAPGETM